MSVDEHVEGIETSLTVTYLRVELINSSTVKNHSFCCISSHLNPQSRLLLPSKVPDREYYMEKRWKYLGPHLPSPIFHPKIPIPRKLFFHLDSSSRLQYYPYLALPYAYLLATSLRPLTYRTSLWLSGPPVPLPRILFRLLPYFFTLVFLINHHPTLIQPCIFFVPCYLPTSFSPPSSKTSLLHQIYPPRNLGCCAL